MAANSTESQVLSNISSTNGNIVKTFKFDDQIQRITLGSIFIVICLIGIFGNSLVILAVLLSRKLRTVSNVFVVNLSIADLLTCAFMPGTVAQFFAPLGVQVGPDWLCFLIPAVNHTGIGVSVLTLASISLTRALIVSRPLAVRFPRWLMTLWLTFIWFIPSSIDVFVPQFVWEESILGYNYKYGICTQKNSHPKILLYNGIAFLVTFPLPFVIIFASFMVIFINLKRHSRDLISGKTITRNDKHAMMKTNETQTVATTPLSLAIEDQTTKLRLQRRQVLITKNMMVVVCVFFACIGPYTLGVVIPDTAPAMPYLAILIYFNNCVNPIIYAKHPNFREVYSYILSGNFKDIPEKTALLESLLKSSIFSGSST